MGARANRLDISDSFCVLQLISQNACFIYRCDNSLICFAFRKYFEQKLEDYNTISAIYFVALQNVKATS